jgi:hypothetical protein
MIPLESSARMITFSAEVIVFCVTVKTTAGPSPAEGQACSFT